MRKIQVSFLSFFNTYFSQIVLFYTQLYCITILHNYCCVTIGLIEVAHPLLSILNATENERGDIGVGEIRLFGGKSLGKISLRIDRVPIRLVLI